MNTKAFLKTLMASTLILFVGTSNYAMRSRNSLQMENSQRKLILENFWNESQEILTDDKTWDELFPGIEKNKIIAFIKALQNNDFKQVRKSLNNVKEGLLEVKTNKLSQQSPPDFEKFMRSVTMILSTCRKKMGESPSEQKKRRNLIMIIAMIPVVIALTPLAYYTYKNSNFHRLENESDEIFFERAETARQEILYSTLCFIQ